MHFLQGTGPINVCTNFEIIGTKLTNLENMKKSYVLFDVTWRKNGTSCVKVLKNALCFIMGYFVAMETYVTLLLFMYIFAMHIL